MGVALMVTKNFWQGKRVFVTGHTGFKGSWLCLWLHNMGALVSGYALSPPTNPSLFVEANLRKIIASEEGDICDVAHLHKTMDHFQPEIVFHMAAQSLVRLSYESPLETYNTNIMGTISLLEVVRRVGNVKVVINVTSDKCYENQEWPWGYRESEPMGGFDPYSCSKGCAELITASYRQSFFNSDGCALASVRAGNVIGGGDWALDRLVPDVLKAFSNSKKVSIRYPNALRPWQHVLEPLSGYLMLAEQLYSKGLAFAEGWNFGPKEDNVHSVEWIVEYLKSQWGEGASWEHNETPQFHEANFLKLDCSKAKTKLGWQPLWDIGYTLNRTVAWYKAWQEGVDMYKYTIREINEYME